MRNLFEPPATEDIKEISYEEFCMFFFSSLNSVYHPEKSNIYQD